MLLQAQRSCLPTAFRRLERQVQNLELLEGRLLGTRTQKEVHVLPFLLAQVALRHQPCHICS